MATAQELLQAYQDAEARLKAFEQRHPAALGHEIGNTSNMAEPTVAIDAELLLQHAALEAERDEAMQAWLEAK